MINKSKYFDYLYQVLVNNNLVPDDNLWRTKLESQIDQVGINREIYLRLMQEYSANFNEVALINTSKNICLCKSLGVKVMNELIVSSVSFITLGCFLDYMMDSKNPKMVKYAKQKLDWNYCKKWFVDFQARDGNNIDEILFEEISFGLKWIYSNNKELYLYLIKIIKAAAEAEVAVMEPNFEADDNFNIIYNKSAVFTKISLLLAAGNKKEWNKAEIQSIENIGMIFLYMDDLIDFFEDKLVGQKNVIDMLIIKNRGSWELVIEMVVKKIINYIDKMSLVFENDMIKLVKNEIKEWLFSNEDLILRHNREGLNA